MPSKWRPYCETHPKRTRNTHEISSHGSTRILDMATVQTIVRSNRYLVASTYFSTIERSGIQLRSGESDLLQRQYGGPRQCPHSSNDVANTALGVPHADQIRSYWASESSIYTRRSAGQLLGDTPPIG